MNSSTSVKLASIALAVAGLASAPASMAATATGSLAVSAAVLSTCVVVSTPLVFGNYTLATVDATGLISVTCTPDITSYNVALGSGTGTGATTSARKLTSATSSDTLTYSLYRDSGRTQNWGDVPNVDTAASANATTTVGAVKSFTVFGRVAAGQASATGSYLDTVQINVNY
ncbi:spore coat U domain-containing protein [Polaromonas sp.]|uniref:Csu type fimbrial protein n=1 Tax=Polaromonas sp. TaxID=1869339 RepID=UPI00286CD759|nr:spore coat U domain-containing protein [Polaromonas sp.]